MPETRIEQDSLGAVTVPSEALYGAQTQRAIDNFTIGGQPMPKAFIRSLILIKAASAKANGELRCIHNNIAKAISDTCLALLNQEDFMKHFPVEVFQTGSGTSSNMNANEVIATLASQKLGIAVDPNDHVNFGQSSNDVVPSTIHVSVAIELNAQLLPALEYLAETIETKSLALERYCKTGRTHLMDAMPITLQQSLGGWAAQIRKAIIGLTRLQPSLQSLAQGGTAVGTGINTHERFAEIFIHHLNQITDLTFTTGENYFELISSQDTAVSLSGQLKSAAVAIMKISNDLRWMNSGPLSGLSEISLEPLQPGSSIMPGKVNPVIPEATAMAAAQIIGNDVAITIGGQSGNFELNVMLPLIAANLLNSIHLLSNSCCSLADKAIKNFTVNEAQIQHSLYRNPILVTALNPIIGYSKAAEIAKQAYSEKRSIIDVAEENTDLSREELAQLLDPIKLTRGGL